MKQLWKNLLAGALLPCLLAGCGAQRAPEETGSATDHLLGQTQEQRL